MDESVDSTQTQTPPPEAGVPEASGQTASTTTSYLSRLGVTEPWAKTLFGMLKACLRQPNPPVEEIKGYLAALQAEGADPEAVYQALVETRKQGLPPLPAYPTVAPPSSQTPESPESDQSPADSNAPTSTETGSTPPEGQQPPPQSPPARRVSRQ